MEKIVGIELTVAVEVKEEMTDDEVEDLAVQMMFDYNKNRHLIKINGVEIIMTEDF